MRRLMIADRAPRPTIVYDRYRVALAHDARKPPWQWTFKCDPGYRTVVEHVEPEQGQAFLEWAAQDAYREMWNAELVCNLARRNDSLGAPVQATYNSLNITCSPSNWRYLCHALKVWKYVEQLGLEKVHIVEVGGGYGGLALFTYGLRPHRVKSYAIIDVPEAIVIQQAYAKALGIPVYVGNGLDGNAIQRVMPPDDGVPRLFVSAYAFSEFEQPMRDWYASRVIPLCDHGLIVWNFPEPVQDGDGRIFGGPVYTFTDRPIHCEPDMPPLYEGHLLVTF